MRISKLIVMLAAALLCGALCVTAMASVYSRELAQPGDFSFGIFDRVEMSDSAGGLLLSKSMNCVPYLWVPSPDESVVTKIDARSGKEMARYRMGPESSGWNPCAVATDEAGNAYVACGSAGAGKIVKIQVFGASKSINQAPGATSFDFTGNGKADALPWGRDTRVTELAEVGRQPSSLAFDEQGLLWVGLWGEQSIVAVDTGKGVVVKTIYLTGKPDTMIVGSRSSLWVLCGEQSRLACIDTILGSVRSTFDLGETDARSMCVGDENTLWLGTSSGLAKFDTLTGSITQMSRADVALGGVALDRSGSIWAACPELNQLTRFSASDLNTTAQVPVGTTPDSVSADGDGYVWALNAGSSNASRVDPRTAKCAATAPTARSAYSSTPFTACVMRPGISPSGSWVGLFDSKLPGAGWGTISWDASMSGSKIIVEARSSDLPTAITDQQFHPVNNGQEAVLPSGQYLEVKVSFVGGMNTTPILRYMRIDGRNLPPDTSRAGPTVSLIRRLDHKFDAIGITGVSDPEGDDITITITGVTQDEPIAGLWQGDKAPDAIGIGKPEVQLRGECDPGTPDKPGNGRVYIVSFRATDPQGASSSGKVRVMVPASLKWDAVAVEDHDKYDSTKDPAKEAQKG